MTELDVMKAETKATYEEIKAYVLEHAGLKVSYLYIAQIKAKHGINERDCYNIPKTEGSLRRRRKRRLKMRCGIFR